MENVLERASRAVKKITMENIIREIRKMRRER